MNGQVMTTGSSNTATAVGHIAGLLKTGGAVTQGDLAALRRMDPRHPAPAFFKIEGLVLDECLPGDAEARFDLETRWAAVVSGLAILGRLHQPGVRLGSALVDAQYSELRFSRLMRSDVDRLADELPALARFLAAKGVRADWAGASQLILSAGTRREEEVRRHIARDYYGALSRHESR
jgi:CRISPR type I-E-associated protein CasB/Cse2